MWWNCVHLHEILALRGVPLAPWQKPPPLREWYLRKWRFLTKNRPKMTKMRATFETKINSFERKPLQISPRVFNEKCVFLACFWPLFDPPLELVETQNRQFHEEAHAIPSPRSEHLLEQKTPLFDHFWPLFERFWRINSLDPQFWTHRSFAHLCTPKCMGTIFGGQ